MQKDWIKFYKENQAPTEPSTFARFVMEKNLPGDTLVDIGSGNGRDTYFLGEKYIATGIDPNCEPETTARAGFIKDKVSPSLVADADIVYSRFFLHTISADEISELLFNTKKYFCAEARVEGDEPMLYPEHERNFINGEWLLDRLISQNFEVLYFEKARGLAPYKGEDPFLLRVIAKKIC